jgi:hypothetical protein
MNAREPLSTEERIISDRLRGEWPMVEPGTHLDRAILERARISVVPGHVRGPRQPWLVGLATAATLVLTFGVIWRTMEAPRRDELYRPPGVPVMSTPATSPASAEALDAVAPAKTSANADTPGANDDTSTPGQAVSMESPPAAPSASRQPDTTASAGREQADQAEEPIRQGATGQVRDAMRQEQAAATTAGSTPAAPAPPPPPPTPEPEIQQTAPAAPSASLPFPAEPGETDLENAEITDSRIKPVESESSPTAADETRGDRLGRARMPASVAPPSEAPHALHETSPEPFPADSDQESASEKQEGQAPREMEYTAPPAPPAEASAMNREPSQNVGQAAGAPPASSPTDGLNSSSATPSRSSNEKVPSAREVQAAADKAVADIRQMVRDGRKREALRAIAVLRERYPTIEMPEDLARFERIESDGR